MLLSVLLSVHYRHHLANKLWARRFFLLTNVFSFSFSQRNYLDTMLSCYLFLVISLMISFRDVRVSASGKCPVICCAQRFFFSPYFWGVECCCFKVIQQFDASCFYYETQRLNYFIMSHVIKQMGGDERSQHKVLLAKCFLESTSKISGPLYRWKSILPKAVHSFGVLVVAEKPDVYKLER